VFITKEGIGIFYVIGFCIAGVGFSVLFKRLFPRVTTYAVNKALDPGEECVLGAYISICLNRNLSYKSRKIKINAHVLHVLW